jgi:hypothetical protein
MATSFAALLFRPEVVPDAALARGFAVALAGWDAPAPRLLIAPLPGLPGWSAAFYASGARAEDEDELEHAAELFADEVSPAVGVLDAAAEVGAGAGTVFTLVFAEDVIHDDGWRFTAEGFTRHFVRDGDDGLEAGVETAEGSEVHEVVLDLPEEASDAEEQAAVERAVRPHRGSTFLSGELGAPVLPALMGALFAAERRVAVRLIEPDPASIAAEVRRLVRALHRVEGRSAFTAPKAVAGVGQPAAHAAFVQTYDWADPTDPEDAYRELAIGAVVGTLRFLREDELRARDGDPRWAMAARAGLYPVARLSGSALGSAALREAATLGLAADGERLALVRAKGSIEPAGPTFGELLRYLSLGWSRRSDAEEDLIGALMLRARIRLPP